MTRKKIIALIIAAVCLSGCAGNDVPPAETSAETESVTVSVSETEALPVSEETTADTTETSTETEAPEPFEVKYGRLRIYADIFTEEDMAAALAAWEQPNDKSLSVCNWDGIGLSCLAEFNDCASLVLSGYMGSIEDCVDIIEKLDPDDVWIYDENYTYEKQLFLYEELPDMKLNYEWRWHGDIPEEGFVYYLPFVISAENKSGREFEKEDALHYTPWHDIYFWELEFKCSNYTDKAVTVDSVQIIEVTSGTVMTFADGSDRLAIDFTVDPRQKADYILGKDKFDYSACKTGVYKTVLYMGNESKEMYFFIDNTANEPEILTPEQQEIFYKAYDLEYKSFWNGIYLTKEYAAEHTAEEFAAIFEEAFTEEYIKKNVRVYADENGNKCGDITYEGHYFLPVYSDENEVRFMAMVVHGHGDNPYLVWFEPLEYRMVKTEKGWRMDNFPEWN